MQKDLWRPRHWSLLENQCTTQIEVHMRQQPQNVLDTRTFVCACVRVIPNQSMPRVRTLADQSDRGSDFQDTSLVGFLHRASPAGSASLPSRCPQLFSTPTCWSLLIQSLSLANAYLFSLSGGTAYTRDDQRILLEISVSRPSSAVTRYRLGYFKLSIRNKEMFVLRY